MSKGIYALNARVIGIEFSWQYMLTNTSSESAAQRDILLKKIFGILSQIFIRRSTSHLVTYNCEFPFHRTID